MAWSGALLTAETLACQRGVRLLFEDLSFRVCSGEALIVVGANGVGKSSLLRIIAGLRAPCAGHIRLSGLPDDAPHAEQVHYLGHEDAVKATLTVAANLAFWRKVLGPTGQDVEEALEEVGLGGLGRLPATALSAGQKRRLALARLLVCRRPLWVLDEPTTALDASGQALFAARARAHLSEGGLIIAATHAPLDLGSQGRELRLGGGA